MELQKYYKYYCGITEVLQILLWNYRSITNTTVELQKYYSTSQTKLYVGYLVPVARAYQPHPKNPRTKPLTKEQCGLGGGVGGGVSGKCKELFFCCFFVVFAQDNARLVSREQDGVALDNTKAVHCRSIKATVDAEKLPNHLTEPTRHKATAGRLHVVHSCVFCLFLQCNSQRTAQLETGLAIGIDTAHLLLNCCGSRCDEARQDLQ